MVLLILDNSLLSAESQKLPESRLHLGVPISACRAPTAKGSTDSLRATPAQSAGPGMAVSVPPRMPSPHPQPQQQQPAPSKPPTFAQAVTMRVRLGITCIWDSASGIQDAPFHGRSSREDKGSQMGRTYR